MKVLESFTGALSTDIIIIVAVFFIFFFYAIHWGKSNSISLLISFYIGMLAFISFPYLDTLTILKSSETQVALSHLAIFLLGVFIIHYILRYSLYAEYPPHKITKLIQAGILAASSTGLLFAFTYHSFSISLLYDFSPSIDTLFSPEFFFWWLVAPLVGLAIVSRA